MADKQILSPEQRAEMVRELMELRGEEAPDMVDTTATTPDVDNIQQAGAAVTDWMTSTDQDSAYYWGASKARLAQLADQWGVEYDDEDAVTLASEMMAMGVQDPNRALDALADKYEILTRDVAANVTDAAVDTGNWFQRMLSRAMGNPDVNLALGLAEPLMRPQQAWFTLLRGEGFDRAWAKMRPKVHVTLADGSQDEVDPWLVTMENLSYRMTGKTTYDENGVPIVSNQDRRDESNRKIVEAQQQMLSEDRVLEFRDVVDTWVGDENMDKVYSWLMDDGPYKYQRRMLAGGLSVIYGLNEIYNDPLFFGSPIRKALARGAKVALTSSASRARRTAEVAQRTSSFDDMTEAMNEAANHLNNAINRYNETPTIYNARNVEIANRLLEERTAHRELYNANRAIGDHSKVNYDTPIQPGNGEPDLGLARELVENAHQARHKSNVVFEREWTRPTITRKIRRLYDRLASQRANGDPLSELKITEGEIKYYEDMLYAWDNMGWRARPVEVGAASAGGDLLHVAYDADMGDLARGVMFYRGSVQSGGKSYATAVVNPRARVLRIPGEARTKMILEDIKRRKANRMGGIVGFKPETWPRNPGWFVLRKFGEDKLLDEITRFDRSGHNVKELIQQAIAPMSLVTERGRKLQNYYPDLTTAMREMDIGALNLIEDSATMGEMLGLHIARSKGFDAIEMGPLNRKYIEAYADNEMLMGTATDQQLKAMRDMRQTQFIALNPRAVERLNGVPITHRRFYEDLVQMRQAMAAEARSLSRVAPERAKEIEQGLKHLDAYVQAMENGDLHKVPHTVEFSSGYVRKRTAQEMADILASEKQSARAMAPEEFQPRDQLQGSLFDDADLAARVAQPPDEAEQVADFLGRWIHGDDPLELYMPECQVPEYATKTYGERIPGVGPELQIQGERVAANIAAMEKEEIAKARLYIPAKLLDDGTYVPERSLRFTQPNIYDKAQKIAKAEGTKFDDSWLPKPRKTTAELVESGWWDWHHAMNLHRISRGLFPGTWYPKTTGRLMPYLMNGREPMRVLEEVDPGVSWPLLLNATRNQTAEYERNMTIVSRALNDLGAISIEEPSALRSKLMTDARRRIARNKERGQEIFELLEMDSRSPEFREAFEAMSPVEQQAMRALRAAITETGGKLGIYGTDKWIEDFMPHVFNMDELRKGGMPPEMRGVGTHGNIFISHLLGRNGAEGYIKDPYDVLDVYFRAAARKVVLEPALNDFLKRATHISRQPGMGWYLPYAEGVVRQAKGMPSKARQWVNNNYMRGAATMGRPYRPDEVGQRLMAISGAVYAGLLAGNPRYLIMSIATNLATTGADLGLFNLHRGLFLNATPEGQALFKAAGGDQMWMAIFEDQNYNKLQQIAARGRLGMPSIQDTEDFIRGTTMMAAIEESLHKAGYARGFAGLEQAAEEGFANKIIFDAVRRTQEVNHFFGPMGKPPAMTDISRSGAVVGTQFMSFIPKQSEQLLSMARKDPGKIFDYIMLSGWLSRVAASELGINIRSYTGFGYLTDINPTEMGKSPSLQVLLRSAQMMGQISATVAGKGEPMKLHRSVEDWKEAMENMVPLINVARTRTRAERMLEQGIQEYGMGVRTADPGEIIKLGPLGIPVPGGSKGNRNEAVGIVTGVETELQRRNRLAMQEFRKVQAEAAYDTYMLIEEALQFADTGDDAGMMERAARLYERNIPIGDLTDPVITRKRLQTMQWTMNVMLDNPRLRGPLFEVLQGWNLME